MKEKTLFQKFMSWLKKEDPEFYKKYKKSYQDDGKKITLLNQGLTIDEETAVRHKTNLYRAFEKQPPK